MEKKTILFLVLTVVIFWFSNQFLLKNNTKANNTDNIENTVENINKETNINKNTQTSQISLQIDSLSAKDVNINENIKIENNDLIVSFTNKGAKINSIILKNHYDTYEKKRLVNLVPPNSDLLGVNYSSTNGNKSLDNLIFKHEINKNANFTDISFYLENESKRTLIKKYTIGEAGFNIDFNFETNDFSPIINYNLNFKDGINEITKFKRKTSVFNVTAQVDKEIERVKLNKLEKKEKLLGSVDWVSSNSKYFTIGIIPEERLNIERVNLFVGSEKKTGAFDIKVQNDEAYTKFSDSYKIYAGPIDIENLKAYNIGFENTAEMGMSFLRPISKLFLSLLLILKNLIPNFGIAIIILAIILKLVLYPFTHKSLESTQKLKKINPQMKAIQQQYKTDPKQMQIELKKLYKEHGVSPLGGCLPMLAQMPILISLYPVLRFSILMRQEPFMLWIKDLSSPDPYFILPILMGIFMFIQQKMMSPTAIKSDDAEVDEKQQAAEQSQKLMMYAMPIVLFFVFKSFPAGLVLYWLFYNILTVVQQLIIKRKTN